MQRAKARAKSGRSVVISSIFFVSIIFFCQFRAGAQQLDDTFNSGEKISYGAYYNWNFIWINAGEVTFTADTIRYNEQNEWQFSAIGKTYKAYDLFYTVRDTFQSRVICDGFRPDYFIRKVNHGKSSTVHEYQFKEDSKEIHSYIKREKEEPFRDVLQWQPNTSDMLSTVYSFRDFKFEGLKKDDQVNFRMLVDNKTEDLYFRYRGLENIKTRNGRKFRCHHIVIRLLGGDFFPDGEHMNVWFTADQNHIPIKVETEILVGSVSAILTDLEHIKYPLTSEIN